LGLSLAHRLIEFHQGRVVVEDRGAKGTAFCVDLPTGAEFTNPKLDLPRLPRASPSEPVSG
jgi:signal transduction histidine kinase